MPNTSTWFLWYSILFIPFLIFAEAGEIRSVHLQQEGVPTSISQIIKHGARRFGLLLVVLIISTLLYYILLGVIRLTARLLLSQVPVGDMQVAIITISSAIIYPFIVFAQCAIVISDLRIKSSLSMVFRVLNNYTITILTSVAVFGILRYFIAIIRPLAVTNPVQISCYLLALLIVEGVQTAFFTIVYLHYIRESIIPEPVQLLRSPDAQVPKSNQAQSVRPKLWLLIILGIIGSQLTNFIIYAIVIFTGLGKTFNHGDGYIYALDLTLMFNAMAGIILGAVLGPLVGVILFKITRNRILALLAAFIGGVIPILFLWNIV